MRKFFLKLALMFLPIAALPFFFSSCEGGPVAGNGNGACPMSLLGDSVAYKVYKLIPESDLPSHCVNLAFADAVPSDDVYSFCVKYPSVGKECVSGSYDHFSLQCFPTGAEDELTVCFSAYGIRDGITVLEFNGVYSLKNGVLEKKNVQLPSPNVSCFFEDEVNLLGIPKEIKDEVLKNYSSHYHYTFVPQGDESVGGVLVGLDLSFLSHDPNNVADIATPSLFYEMKEGTFVRNSSVSMDSPACVITPSGFGGENGFRLGGRKHMDSEILTSYQKETKDDRIIYRKNGDSYFSAQIDNDFIVGINIYTRKFALSEEIAAECHVGGFLDQAFENGFAVVENPDGKCHSQKVFGDYVVELVADDKESFISEISLKLSSDGLLKVRRGECPVERIMDALPKDYRIDSSLAISFKKRFFETGDGCEIVMKDYDNVRYWYMMKCLPLSTQGEYDVYVAIYSWESQRTDESLDELNRIGSLKLEDVNRYRFSPSGVKESKWDFDSELDRNISRECKVYHFDEDLGRIRISFFRLDNSEPGTVTYKWNSRTEEFVPGS